MDLKVDKQKNNTYKVLITISKEEVTKAYDHALEHETEDFEAPGFRKGKAPKNVVKEKLDPSKLRGHAINVLLSEAYGKAIKENKLNPIVSPEFDIEKFEEGEEAKVTMTIIEKPEIKIGDYKKSLKKLGDSKSKDAKDDESKSKDVSAEEIVDCLLGISEIDIAESLVESEVNRMMSSLIDQTGRLGLTIDQYLESINRTATSLRDDYKLNASKTLKADFLITEIAKQEGITVVDEEVDFTINSIPDVKSREALNTPNQRLYVKAILLKNKALQHLADLTQPKDEAKSDKKDVKADK